MSKKHRSRKLIVIEGMDGSGKTTVARALSRRIRGKYIKTPLPPLASMRAHIDRVASLPTRFLFYLASVAHASDRIKKSLKTTHVVCDRYLASTVACHRALGLSLRWRFHRLDLAAPDYTFLLTVNREAERLRRLKARGQSTAADQLFKVTTLRRRLKQQYARFSFVTIDTSDLTPAEVVREILKVVRL